MTEALLMNERKAHYIAACVMLLITSVGVMFKILFTPTPPPGVTVFWLVMNPQIEQTVSRILQESPTDLLLPMVYETVETKRYYWPTTSIVILYGLYKMFSPLGVYLFLSTLFGVVTFVLSWLFCRQLVLSASLLWMFTFGTHFNYQFTYGALLDGYLVLTYVTINLFIAARLLSSQSASRRLSVAYVCTLLLVALSSEVWLNYGVGLIVAALFLVYWGKRHGDRAEVRAGTFVALTTSAIMAVYLVIRIRVAGQYLVPGSEEELVVTYSNMLFLVEDMVANFFTLLYMTLSNYLPSFVTASNSLVYFGTEAILAEQYGYHQEYTHLVGMSHLFHWRFYAGVLVAVYLYGVGKWLLAARQYADARYAVYVALSMLVLAGFSTHLVIKMRPYNVVPALPYKPMISIYAFTLLLAYVAAVGRQRFVESRSYTLALSCLWGSVLVAAFTRPRMQGVLLSKVGLVGLGDPLAKILQWLQ